MLHLMCLCIKMKFDAYHMFSLQCHYFHVYACVYLRLLCYTNKLNIVSANTCTPTLWFSKHFVTLSNDMEEYDNGLRGIRDETETNRSAKHGAEK